MAEQQRRGALVGLAVTSALMVLLASGVAVSRLRSDDRSDRASSPLASPSPTAPPSAAPAPSIAGGDIAPPATGSPGAASGGAPGSSDRVADATGTGAGPDGVPAPSPGGRSAASGAPAPAPPEASSTDRSGSCSQSGGDCGGGAPGSNGSPGGSGSPPAPQHGPGQEPLAAAAVSAGQGSTGCVVAAGLGDSPDADVTVGTNRVVGDAPPSNGTGVSLGGRLVHPPSSIPVLPG